MNESILRALMRLFAIVANVNKEGVTTDSRIIVQTYLNQKLNEELVAKYLSLFDQYLEQLNKRKSKGKSGKERKQTSLNSVKVLLICNEINEELQQKDKIVVLVRLLEFIDSGGDITEKEFDFIDTVADTFNITKDDYRNVRNFVLTEGKIESADQSSVLSIEDTHAKLLKPVLGGHETLAKRKVIQRKGLDNPIVILYVKSTNTYFMKYKGHDTLYINGLSLVPQTSYVLTNGSMIKGNRIEAIYHSDITNVFMTDMNRKRVVFSANEIAFRFKGSTNGIQQFTFTEESGRLVGIMGGSGVGKSTLLNIFNGNIKPNEGAITINGLNLHSDKEKLEGIIGFVPQDDLLIEELSVYQNLYYNAKLCFNNLSELKIKKLVIRTLTDLDLNEIKHLTVGDPLNKFISGGQRKRLNIALELIREPSILIVDEPTSGLSSQDSEMVMSLLKEQTRNGRLVIVNIHQPSSDIYKMFDKLLVMDKGGHPAYYGNPIDAVVYFKKQSNHINADESECITCGNVNPEQMLQILEAKVVNSYGKLTKNRKRSPQEWYRLFTEKINFKNATEDVTEELPKNNFQIPGLFKQFRIFGIRNLLAKITNKQYLLVNLLEAPLLAVMLGYFTKYIAGTVANPNAYVFSENENIPAFLFMSVIVALFFGLTVSAEEIIRDRKILKREAFLNLSRFSYLNSKLLFLFGLSAIQTLSFVLIGNWILGIQGMTMAYWAILFTTAAFANMLGLNISSALDSVVTIYVLIPFILVPQLSFSGVIVNFSHLHKSVVNPLYTPVVGDIMTSRWAYEALTVVQFKNNKYDKIFYPYDKKMSDASFKALYLVPELESRIDAAMNYIRQELGSKKVEAKLKTVRNEIAILNASLPKNKFNKVGLLTHDKITPELATQAKYYLQDVKKYYNRLNQYTNGKKDEKFKQLSSKFGGKYDLVKLKQAHHNRRLSEQLLNKNEARKVKESNNRIVRLKDPVYNYPSHNLGRSHFYAPVKKMFGQYLETFYFNIFFIWFTTIILYVTLLNDSLRKLLTFMKNTKFIKPKKTVT